MLQPAGGEAANTPTPILMPNGDTRRKVGPGFPSFLLLPQPVGAALSAQHSRPSPKQPAPWGKGKSACAGGWVKGIVGKGER